MKEEEKQGLQQKVLEAQLLEQHIKEVQQHLQILRNKSEELTKTVSYLSGLEPINGERKSFSGISSGIFVETSIKNTKEVLVGVGSGVIVRKTLSEAKVMVESQSEEVKKAFAEIEERLEKAISQLGELKTEIGRSQN